MKQPKIFTSRGRAAVLRVAGLRLYRSNQLWTAFICNQCNLTEHIINVIDYCMTETVTDFSPIVTGSACASARRLSSDFAAISPAQLLQIPEFQGGMPPRRCTPMHVADDLWRQATPHQHGMRYAPKMHDSVIPPIHSAGRKAVSCCAGRRQRQRSSLAPRTALNWSCKEKLSIGRRLPRRESQPQSRRHA